MSSTASTASRQDVRGHDAVPATVISPYVTYVRPDGSEEPGTSSPSLTPMRFVPLAEVAIEVEYEMSDREK